MPLCESWVTSADYCDPCTDYSLDPDLLEEFGFAASEVLYSVSGQQFTGICEATNERPCVDCHSTFSAADRLTNLTTGSFPCGCSGTESCGSRRLHRIELLHKPVVEVSEVLINGATLDPSLYWVNDQAYLIRLPNPDGSNPGWPHQQYVDLPETSDGTFSVTYTYGREVPVLGRRAAAILACEFYMACNPEGFDGLCRLPRNVVSMTRQGVSVAFESAFFTARPGRTVQFGIPEIDMFLVSVNPHGNTSKMVILSPDDPDIATYTNT